MQTEPDFSSIPSAVQTRLLVEKTDNLDQTPIFLENGVVLESDVSIQSLLLEL